MPGDYGLARQMYDAPETCSDRIQRERRCLRSCSSYDAPSCVRAIWLDVSYSIIRPHSREVEYIYCKTFE